LYERDAGHFDRERLRAWQLYNDALPARRALRDSLRRTVEEWTHGA
jgi:hypothetical protein